MLDIVPEDFDRGVLPIFPHGEARVRKRWVRESAHGDRDQAGHMIGHVMHGRSAGRAKMISDGQAAVRGAAPRGGLTLDRDLFRGPARLDGEGAAGALLTGEAMAGGNTDGVAGGGGAELAATAGGGAGGQFTTKALDSML